MTVALGWNNTGEASGAQSSLSPLSTFKERDRLLGYLLQKGLFKLLVLIHSGE